MKRIVLLWAAVLFACAARLPAAELVGVHGSGTQYTTTMDLSIGGKPIHLVLTGTAVRQKFFFNVYSIGSYIAEGVPVHTAEELAVLDEPKQLHLVMERDVQGSDMGEAFLVAVRRNYPMPIFNVEVNRLVAILRDVNFKKGDHVYLTHQPGVGLHFRAVGKDEFTIENPDFSRAIWDIYLGKNNVGDAIKKGLVSRLK